MSRFMSWDDIINAYNEDGIIPNDLPSPPILQRTNAIDNTDMKSNHTEPIVHYEEKSQDNVIYDYKQYKYSRLRKYHNVVLRSSYPKRF